jgi:hypothetical protein
VDRFLVAVMSMEGKKEYIDDYALSEKNMISFKVKDLKADYPDKVHNVKVFKLVEVKPKKKKITVIEEVWE